MSDGPTGVCGSLLVSEGDFWCLRVPTHAYWCLRLPTGI